MQNPSSDLQLAITAAQKAGGIIREGYGNIQSITNKEEGKGILTDVDQKSEGIIIKTLQEKSEYAILAEETGDIKGKGDAYWVIDPLDGTTNFSREIPFFCVSIALLKNNQVELGVTLNPMTNECFYAEQGKGAYKNENPIRVSNRSFSKSPVIFISNGYAKEDKRIFAKATDRLSTLCSLRKLGSTALELCYVAQGSVEGFLSSGDELWDYAAGIVLIEEAGGKVTDWKGNKWDNSSSFILASNGLAHEDLLKYTRDLQNA